MPPLCPPLRHPSLDSHRKPVAIITPAASLWCNRHNEDMKAYGEGNQACDAGCECRGDFG